MFLNEDLFRGHQWSSLNHCITTGHAVRIIWQVIFQLLESKCEESENEESESDEGDKSEFEPLTQVDLVAQEVGIHASSF